MKEIKFSKNLSNEEYLGIFNEFLDNNGYMSKCVSNNKVIGYLVRCEVPEYDGFICMLYEPINDANHYSRKQKLVKAIAMSRVLKGGQRVLKNFLKNKSLSEFKSESFTNLFDSFEELPDNVKEFYKSENFNYQEFYKYVKSFENKVKKYYKNKEQKIIWLSI